MKRIKIFDTTLRDGSQSPGIIISKSRKIKVAKLLDALGVDKIEVGFPFASKIDYEAIKETRNLKAEMFALARPKEEDIRKAKETGVKSIHMFIPSSLKFIKAMYKTSNHLLKEIEESLELAKELSLKTELSLMDAPRAKMKTIKKIVRVVEKNQIETLNIADTSGIASPQKSAELIKKVKAITPLPLSVHFHNDLGLATANTLEALAAGAEQAHVTVAGIGERCGNAALEEVVVAAEELYGFKTKIKLNKLKKVTDDILKILKTPLSDSKPVIGKNMFCHNNSLHITHPELFEAVKPKSIGGKRVFLFGKHSGKSAIKKTLEKHGVKVNETYLERLTKKIKYEGEKGKRFTEKELIKSLRQT